MDVNGSFPTGIESIMRKPDSQTQESEKKSFLDSKYLENSFQSPTGNPISLPQLPTTIPIGQMPALPMNIEVSNDISPETGPNATSNLGSSRLSPHANLHSATTQDLQSVTEATNAAYVATNAINKDTSLPQAIAEFRKQHGFNPKSEAAFINRFEMNEKIRCLTTIQEYKKRGVTVQALTVSNSLLDIKTELERIRRSVEIDASVTSYKSMLMFFVVGCEMANKFSRKKLNLDNWSQSFSKYDMPKCELLLFQIAEQEKQLMGPKSLLVFTVLGSAFFFHFSQGVSTELGRVFGNKMAGNIMDSFSKNPTAFMNFFSGSGNNNNSNNNNTKNNNNPATAQERVSIVNNSNKNMNFNTNNNNIPAIPTSDNVQNVQVETKPKRPIHVPNIEIASLISDTNENNRFFEEEKNLNNNENLENINNNNNNNLENNNNNNNNNNNLEREPEVSNFELFQQQQYHLNNPNNNNPNNNNPIPSINGSDNTNSSSRRRRGRPRKVTNPSETIEI